MNETVTVDLDLYLEYKRCYKYVQSEQHTTDLYERKIQELHFEKQRLENLLKSKEIEIEIKLNSYNKVKHGSFSDKLNFLFSKE